VATTNIPSVTAPTLPSPTTAAKPGISPPSIRRHTFLPWPTTTSERRCATRYVEKNAGRVKGRKGASESSLESAGVHRRAKFRLRLATTQRTKAHLLKEEVRDYIKRDQRLSRRRCIDRRIERLDRLHSLTARESGEVCRIKRHAPLMY